MEYTCVKPIRGVSVSFTAYGHCVLLALWSYRIKKSRLYKSRFTLPQMLYPNTISYREFNAPSKLVGLILEFHIMCFPRSVFIVKACSVPLETSCSSKNNLMNIIIVSIKAIQQTTNN